MCYHTAGESEQIILILLSYFLWKKETSVSLEINSLQQYKLYVTETTEMNFSCIHRKNIRNMISLSLFLVISNSVSFNPDCLACWVNTLADYVLKYYSYSSQKIGFDIACKLFPLETICMKCLSLFSGKNKKKIISLSSDEFASGNG